jgi:5,10-methylenetetrahydrofolate reductase
MKIIRHWSARHARTMESLYNGFCSIAPYFSPMVSLIGKKQAEPLLAKFEQGIKGTLFDCTMCGECILSASGMACPMNCGKQLRNGPCGGVAADGGCEIFPDMRCVWLEALDGAKRMANTTAGRQIQPPVDHSKSGSSTWLKIIVNEPDVAKKNAHEHPVIQAHTAGSLERACNTGRPVVTVEISPPDSVNPQDLLQRAEVFRGLVDAINVTDNAGANCHMSSLAASALLASAGHSPVFQSACRDRNRIAVQADIMGAAALGVKNMLCITGDGVGSGDHPQALPVFDLDSVSMLGIAREMRDHGRYASGRMLHSRPELFLGATMNPFAPPYEERIINLEKKIAAGAQFIQTQFCYDLKMFASFMREVRLRGLDRQTHILVGVGPLSSARTARWLKTHVPGVHIPDVLITRMAQAKDQKREGVAICKELIMALKEIAGVAGFHLMGHKNEPLLAEIIVDTGLALQSENNKSSHYTDIMEDRLVA